MADNASTVRLTDLEVIQQFSLAVRGATASRAEVIAALEADLAFLTGGKAAARPAAAPAKAAPAPRAEAAAAAPTAAPTPEKPAKKAAAAKKAPAKKATRARGA